jgi:hypothetical protein
MQKRGSLCPITDFNSTPEAFSKSENSSHPSSPAGQSFHEKIAQYNENPSSAVSVQFPNQHIDPAIMITGPSSSSSKGFSFF